MNRARAKELMKTVNQRVLYERLLEKQPHGVMLPSEDMRRRIIAEAIEMAFGPDTDERDWEGSSTPVTFPAVALELQRLVKDAGYEVPVGLILSNKGYMKFIEDFSPNPNLPTGFFDPCKPRSVMGLMIYRVGQRRKIEKLAEDIRNLQVVE